MDILVAYIKVGYTRSYKNDSKEYVIIHLLQYNINASFLLTETKNICLIFYHSAYKLSPMRDKKI